MRRSGAWCLAAMLLLAPAGARAAPVDLQLLLAVDCSLSVDAEEYRDQVRGLSRAIAHPEVLAAITGGPQGAIAISVVQWASPGDQHVTLPWTRIAGPDEAAGAARAIARMPRATEGGATSVSGVMRFALGHLRDSPHRGDRRVIDVSSDGRNNHGPVLELVREEVARAGVQVNALAIVNDIKRLDEYYRRHIVIGTGAFAIKAEDYADYQDAIRRKLLREIRYEPVAAAPGRQLARRR